MKVLLIFAAIAIACTSASLAGGFRKTEISQYEVTKSALHRQLFTFGKQEFIKKALETKEITTSDWKLSALNSVYTQVVAGLNYKYNAELKNSKGEIIYVTFVVHRSVGANPTFKFVSYKINEEPEY